MSVYKNDNPIYLVEALESLVKQTRQPDEIVLVEDGPITEDLEVVIQQYETKYPSIMNVVRREKNGGLGKALQVAVDNAHYDLIARMDSDDISHPKRFEKQVHFMEEHQEVDICGGDAAKFLTTPDEIIGYRRPKFTDKELKKQLKDKTPFCHVSIMAKKDAILKAGNYVEIFNQEDYYMWARMANCGCVFANIPDILVYVRLVGVGGRRGGWKYFKNEMFMQNYLLKSHIISLPKYCWHVIEKFIIEVLMTAKMRELAYKTLIKAKN
jgi:glycosyltransferase involved in cell wall biosynthesis